MSPEKKHKKSLAICMIVKNEQDNLSRTLPNNVRFSDRTILVDTGSTDKTVVIAKKIGAEVFHFPWNDNFSDARNFSLSKAGEDWILWLDADEFIAEESFIKIRDFLDTTDADYVRIPIYECGYGEMHSDSFYLRDKIFRNSRGARFIKPVNEQLMFPENIKASGVDLKGPKICHWGQHLPDPDMKKKMGPRIGLLKKAAEADKNDYAVRYLLGIRHSEMNQQEEALDYFSQVISICSTDLSGEDQKKYFEHAARSKRARILLESGHPEEALAEALSAVKLAPIFIEPCDCAVMALLRMKKYDEALELTEQMLNLPKIQHPVLLYNEQQDSLLYVLHVRALLKTKGKEAAMSFAEGILKSQPDNTSIKQILEVIGKILK